jgi:MFS transporter, FHS family, glucose/mannose:H+ symporter
MSALETPASSSSARALTAAAYVSFIPTGIVTVLLAPMLPILSERWSLNYSQAGALSTAQYLASTCAVGVAGVLAARWGFRFVIKTGLLFMALGLALLLAGPRILGIFSIVLYGGGQSLVVLAANLLVGAVNPARRSATLNLLNFFWSAGAVACPLLVAASNKAHHIVLFLVLVSAGCLAVALGIALMPASIVEPASHAPERTKTKWRSLLQDHAFFPLAALFFLYVGTENGFGFWVAYYAKDLGSITPAMSLRTPSFFYASLMLGRWLAPFLLRSIGEIRLVQTALILACSGMAGLLFSHDLAAVAASACAAGLGLSCVYPITIALLSSRFGRASSQVGSVLFVLTNIGGGLLPWVVGLSSNHYGSLKAGLLVPLIGAASMLALYLGTWSRKIEDQAFTTA